MTNVGETSVPTTTGPLAAHREHSILVLEHLVTHGPATRSELATATGLGRGAIAGLTARLIDAGVLRPAEHDPSGDGRATPLSLSAADHVLVTTLLRPDEAVATVARLSGEELARFTVPLDDPVADDEAPPAASRALDALAVALDRALARAERSEHPIADVTVLVAGAVAGAPPVVITDPLLGAEPVDVLGELRVRTPGLAAIEARLLLPVTLEPAAAAAAAAERAELPGVHDLLYLDGDTGIGAAAISGGRPLVGAHGLAVTFAHLPVVQGGVRCECGQRGCLATVAAPEIVLERAGLDTFAAGNGHDAALEELVARVGASDDRARWSWLDAALWIGRALQLVVPAVDPAMVVVGGYWSQLLGDIDTAYRSNRPTIGGGALQPVPTITAGRLGPEAALVGARRQARERLIAEPLLLAG
ncbi:putative NBD/HSP70 family sugar kinase [Agromyces ramosus]|uniref:Putative NBD/HSP70 family sugar kinase n=1 Tax=Agromyces ramosus TaxID=33879 RepID=A0A4V2F056_9MICO|nr:ROK family transcriptional regulator [Agromyces ramosus]RZS68820.1 putative NBD/HSP70 family sugar kinase [Agromyces ramosus]